MYNFFKRITDILLSSMALIVLLPLFLIVIILLKFTAEGEVFYYQERIGLNNKKFFIIKFATMLKNSLNMGTGSITLKNDFRVTPIGKILRKTKINEIPQLINILKGDISIVGPRPILESDWLLYEKKIRKKIYNIKPGLTGIGSIVFRDEETIISNAKESDPHKFYKEVIAPYKGELEIWYQNNSSIKLDFILIFLTGWTIIFPENKLYLKILKNIPIRKF